MRNPFAKKPVELVSLNHLHIPVPDGFVEVEKTDGDAIKDMIFTHDLYLQLQNKKTGKILEPLPLTKGLENVNLLADSVTIGNKEYTILRRLQEKNMYGGKRRTHKTRKQRRLSRKSRASRRYTR